MVLDSIRMCGVQLGSDQLPDLDIICVNNIISHNVIKQVLDAEYKAIEASLPYQDFLKGKTRVFIGPGPETRTRSNLHNYLWGHSKRIGFVGKLAGLVYRIEEFTHALLYGRSDEINALEEIEELLLQKHKLMTNTYKNDIAQVLLPSTRKIPKEIHQQAKNILEIMLFKYNSYVTD